MLTQPRSGRGSPRGGRPEGVDGPPRRARGLPPLYLTPRRPPAGAQRPPGVWACGSVVPGGPHRRAPWLELVREFQAELQRRLGRRLRRVVARSSPDDLLYDGNVFVFVDRVDAEALRLVAWAALDVQRRLGVEGLSP
ncbi:MAG: hypothetical protein QI223_02310 [Candidatus Korarchaeota archaeon]|nr:hypothetical protein [Candidatus Korarchaeota archaeon]